MFSVLADVLPSIANQLFSLPVIFSLVLGVIGGLIIGALPGLSATMGVALMIPFTYGMNPIAAIVMLMAIYTSAITGGSVSAILICTPGTPASAATAIDGYPLTEQGKGLKALGVSIISSTIGGLFSGFCLLLISPLLASLSLKFGAPEYFLLAVFGLSIIASLASESLVKGLAAGFLGVVISTIGIDNDSAFPRFTFDSRNLMGGIPPVPALIGLFSIPQVLGEIDRVLRRAKSGAEKEKIGEVKGALFPSWSEFKSILPTIIRSAFIGLYIGILPGAGADIGSWVSYNEAKRFSKKKELFGKGSLEGLAASEAANNAVTGGAMIPMMTLGIPGSAAAAVIMGGLMIQGMVPGAELFTVKAQTTYSVIFGFIIANLFMGIIGLLVSRYVVNITRVPAGLLHPIVVVLSVVGSFAITQNIYNVYVMIVFGVLGYFMKRTKFPASATVLGMLLGSMAETGFRQSIIMARGNVLKYYLSRPLCLVLIGLIILGVILPVIIERSKKRKSIQA